MEALELAKKQARTTTPHNDVW